MRRERMASADLERLRAFLLSEMRTSHVYQRVMIRALLKLGG